MEWIDKIAYTIRRLKLVSISCLLATFIMTYDFLKWIMSSDPTELGEALAVTGVLGSLTALIKFIFDFYAKDTTPKDDK